MAINDAAGMAATSPRGRVALRGIGGSQPCTTAQTAAHAEPAPTAPSADATPSQNDLSSADDAAVAAGHAVFILGEHDLVREGLVDLVSAAPDMVVAGAAAGAEHGLPGIAADAAMVVLFDTELLDAGQVERCRRVSSRHPQVRCLLLTSFDDDEALFTAVMAGAAGYLVKQIGGSKLLDGIRAVAEGRSLLDAAVTGRLLNRLRQGDLDESEQQLLTLVSRGSTDVQIADELSRDEAEVRDDVIALCAKLARRRREPETRPFLPGGV